MAFAKIALTPGVTTQATQTLAEGTWSMSNLIRWRDGFLEKILGWQRIATTPVTGVARALHAFQDLDGNQYLAIGTNSNLQLLNAGTLTDITPVVATVNIATPFTTTNGSATVKITNVAHGANVGDAIDIVTTTSVGGILIQGIYTVTSVIDANNYTILVTSPATSAVVMGGAVPSFATTNTSNIVTVTLANHGLSIGSPFQVQVPTTVGGLLLQNFYTVATVPTANTFTFLAASTATSTTTGAENAGNVRIQYLLPAGNASTVPLVGFGSGGFGTGGYGLTGVGAAFDPLRIWSLDNFGENLLAVPSGGVLYEWLPPLGVGNKATVVATAPTVNQSMFVTMPQAQVFLLGSSTAGIQDPLLIRYSDTGDYTDWTATSTNQAGSYRLSRGSRIVGGLQTGQSALIFTDVGLWSAQYSGPPFVYSFLEISSGCGLIAQKAVCTMSGVTFWLSNQSFYSFNGGTVSPIPCPVWDTIWGNIDTGNLDKCVCAANSASGEVIWFYPEANGTGEISAYVKLNTLNGCWDFGSATSYARTAWIDKSLFGLPIGADLSGYLVQHEVSFDNDQLPMTGVFCESGYSDIGDGQEFSIIDQFLPDFKWSGTNGSVSIYFNVTNSPGGVPTTFGPYVCTPTSTVISSRFRARQIAIRIESEGAGYSWRLGNIRFRIASSGRR